MDILPLDDNDQKLIQEAQNTLQKVYYPGRHTVAAAVLCASGKIYTGINIEVCGYGPCAEPIAIGAAFTDGDRNIISIVAVGKQKDGYAILSPCGNCRQLLVDYVPEAMVIFKYEATISKTCVRNLLPNAYTGNFDRAALREMLWARIGPDT